jgi:hypothetical protein
MVLLADGLKALKMGTKIVGLVLVDAYLNFDSGFDSKNNRKVIFNAGMIPNIKENPRRTFAWEDKFKRLLLRFEQEGERNPRAFRPRLSSPSPEEGDNGCISL